MSQKKDKRIRRLVRKQKAFFYHEAIVSLMKLKLWQRIHVAFLLIFRVYTKDKAEGSGTVKPKAAESNNVTKKQIQPTLVPDTKN